MRTYSIRKPVASCLLFSLLLFKCEKKQEAPYADAGPAYTTLYAKDTGVEFRNDLKETLYMNGLFYEYYYNGGGVAVGDFNGDDLPDLYFISNLQSNKMYLNLGNLKFKDITDQAGVIGKSVFSTGVTTVDINADGLLDIYISSSGRIRDPEKRRNELYINQGVDKNGLPVFTEQAKKYNLNIEAFSTQAGFFDYDRDGDLDMFLINHDVEIYGDDKLQEYLNAESKLSGERLYRNDAGKYVDVTNQAGIINNRLGFGLGLGFGDMNNDGWPDVYVSHDFSGEDHLYLNNKNGTFSESIAKSMGHISNFSMGNDVADYNNDGWLDVMSVDMVSEDNYGIKTSMSGMNPDKFQEHVDLGLHYQYMFNTLQINNGTDRNTPVPYFSEVAHLAGVSNTDWSWAPLFFDMDNDGLKDLFIANGIKRDFRNNDFVSYHKQVRAELLKKKHMDKEAYINHMMSKMPTRFKNNYFYLNKGDLSFARMNAQWNLDSAMTCSNGASYADLDNDGDVDIVVNNMDDFAYIYKNQTMESGDQGFLKIKLRGKGGNTQGIGTRVTIKYAGKVQLQEQYLTRGFQSSVGEVLHFGVGTASSIDKLEVAWPDGSLQRLTNVKANQTITIDQKNAEIEPHEVHREELLFTDITAKAILHKHVENEYNDFDRETLLPHKMSQHGPALAVDDVNKDGLGDIFVGGALGYPATLYHQTTQGGFEPQQVFHQDKQFEDVDAVFFDADNDGDQDLYVVSGGNERPEGSSYYQDRFYENVNGSFSKRTTALPSMPTSGACVKPCDYDADGDLDLFVGGRQVPGKYPFAADSYLLLNSGEDEISFTDETAAKAPMLENLGMVTDAAWTDINGDSLTDLVIVGEWMLIKVLLNESGIFADYTEAYGLSESTGWWSSVATADFDKDGDMDLIAGNLGLNYKYKASATEPFEIYAKDFDDNQSLDIVLGYYNEGKLFPLRGRECTSNQMPFVKKKFASYDAFGKATLNEVYGNENISNALHYNANTFATSYLENVNGQSFQIGPLHPMAQFSSVNAILIKDLDSDTNPDVILAGNMYGAEVETPRNDASYGLFLQGDGKGGFSHLPPKKSGLFVGGDVKRSAFIALPNGETGAIFGTNNGYLKLVKINE